MGREEALPLRRDPDMDVFHPVVDVEDSRMAERLVC